MPINRRNTQRNYGYPQGVATGAPTPIITNRNPTNADLAEVGTTWINTVAGTCFQHCGVHAGVNTWTTAPAAGVGNFAAATVNPGDLDVVAGNVTVGGNSTVTGLTTTGTLICAGASTFGGNIGLTGDLVMIGNLTVTGASTFTGDVDMTNAASYNFTSTNNAPGCITLLANAGVAETIVIQSAQGTGNGSITLDSIAGGITASSALAAATAINLTASDAAGGMTVTTGTGGTVYAITDGEFTVETGTGPIAIGADAFAKVITLGNTTGATSVAVDAGTGGMTLTSTNSALALASGTGAINIGVDASAHTITLGNGTGATSVVVDCGTGACNLGASATDHTTTVGSTTGVSNTIIQGGTAGITLTAPFVTLGTVKLYAGAGVPANALATAIGDTYIRTDAAAANERLYIATALNTWTTITADA